MIRASMLGDSLYLLHGLEEGSALHPLRSPGGDPRRQAGMLVCGLCGVVVCCYVCCCLLFVCCYVCCLFVVCLLSCLFLFCLKGVGFGGGMAMNDEARDCGFEVWGGGAAPAAG